MVLPCLAKRIFLSESLLTQEGTIEPSFLFPLLTIFGQIQYVPSNFLLCPYRHLTQQDAALAKVGSFAVPCCGRHPLVPLYVAGSQNLGRRKYKVLSDKIVKSKKERNIELYKPWEFSKFARAVRLCFFPFCFS